MASGGKSAIPRPTAEMSAIDAAVMCLQDRFHALAQRVRELEEYPGAGREVHALRVASRRASTALSAFRPMLDASDARRARRHARVLRRAAAPLRTLDVHSAVLHEHHELGDPEHAVALDLLLGWMDAERDERRRELDRARRRVTPEKLDRDARRLAESIRPAIAEQPARDNAAPAPVFAHPEHLGRFGAVARAALARLTDEFMAVAAEPAQSFEGLHQVRLKAKKVRYALELLSPALQENLADAALAFARKLQDRLGEVNDSHELAALVSAHARRLKLRHESRTFRSFASLEAAFLRERDQRLEEFDRWWRIRHESFFDALYRLSAGQSPAQSPPPAPSPRGDESPGASRIGAVITVTEPGSRPRKEATA